MAGLPVLVRVTPVTESLLIRPVVVKALVPRLATAPYVLDWGPAVIVRIALLTEKLWVTVGAEL